MSVISFSRKPNLRNKDRKKIESGCLDTDRLGLRSAKNNTPSAFITSLIGAQPIRQNLLNLSYEDSQITVPDNLLAMLSNKQGAVVTADSVQGTTQKAVSFLIDQHNKELLIETIAREDICARES